MRQTLHRFFPVALFGLQTFCQGFKLAFDEHLEDFEASFCVISKVGRLLDQPGLQAREPFIVIAHVTAKDNLAYLINVATFALL